MQTLLLALLLAAILSLLSPALQAHMHRLLLHQPVWLRIVPLLLTAVFAVAAALAGACSFPLVVMLFTYTAAPTLCIVAAGPGPASQPSYWDFAAILLLWLPVEFNAGARLVPLSARGYLHSVAYAIAILLGLTLLRGFRAYRGMKFNLPRSPRDGWLPLAGFAACAPLLVVAGIAIGFIPWPHLPVRSAGAMAAAVPLIFFATALPEEILFRSLIQNLLTLRFGSGWRTLAAASLIFGAAHLDNGPQPQPNWRYFIVATIAGVAYGQVFRKASSVMSSATLHMMVDWTKHFFF
jgi:membrane protease YdiL (CAAX protease family)